MPGNANPPLPPNVPVDPFNPTPPPQAGQTPIAVDDEFLALNGNGTDEDTVKTLFLFADNEFGEDSDPNGDLFTLTEINGVVVIEGDPIVLDSNIDNPDGSGPIQFELTVIDADTGEVTLSPIVPDNSDTLNVGDIAQVTFNYTISDGQFTDTADVTVDISGTNDAAVITGTAAGMIVEDAVPNTVSFDLLSEDVDNLPDTFEVAPAGTPSDEGYGTYEVTAGGVWTYTLENRNPTVAALNASDDLVDTFTVVSEDGTEQQVTITIDGADDAADPDAIDIFIVQGAAAVGNEVLLNTGNGTFIASEADPDTSSSQALALGDFNNDGHLDAYVGNASLPSAPDQVLLGDGLGNFVLAETPPFASDFTQDVALGHFNNDLHLDAFVITHGTGNNHVLLGDGDGTFTAGTAPPGNGSNDVALADFNGDGHLDALVIQSNSVQILEGDGLGGFSIGFNLGGGPVGTGAEVGLGDFNEDGAIDAYFANNIFLPDEFGALQPQPDFILWGDADIDGFGGFGFAPLGEFPDGTAAPALPPAAEQAEGVAVGDVNGDGHFDVFVVNWDADNQVLLGDGTGAFTEAPVPFNPGTDLNQGVSLADLDGDNDLDAVIVGLSGSAQILFNDGNGNFSTGFELPSVGGGTNGFVAGFGDFIDAGTVVEVVNDLPNINPDGLLPDLII